MCGIAGFAHTPLLEVSHLKAMTGALSHRGPDFSSFRYFAETHSGLGSTLLSMTGTQLEGAQPIKHHDSDTWMTFNGEIYNHLSIREELKSYKYPFRTSTDTETVLAALLIWGVNACRRFNGEWAIALYSGKTHELTLIRDRYGIKPLYFLPYNGGVVFASEMKAFWSLSNVLELSVCHEYAIRAVLDPAEPELSGLTLTQDVAQIDPGCYATFSKLSAPTVGRWWFPNDSRADVPSSIRCQAALFSDLFKDACDVRYSHGGDVTFGISGGIDSSSILAATSSVINSKTENLVENRPKAFSFSSHDKDFDEYHFAELVSEFVGFELIKVSEPDLVDAADIAKLYEASILASEGLYYGSSLAHSLLYKSQANYGFNVSMDGHGADELLGGYTWHIQAQRKNNHLGSISFWRSLLQESRLLGDRVSFHWLKAQLRRGMRNYANSNTAIPCLELISRALEPMDDSNLHLNRNQNERRASNNHCLESVLNRDFHQTVLPRVLRHFDALSMAHGVEVRVPFLDHRIVSFIHSLPLESRISSTWTKLILRTAINSSLPSKIVWRREKRGFHSSLIKPLQTTLRPWIEDLLSSPIIYGGFGVNLPFMKTFYSKSIIQNKSTWNEQVIFWRLISLIVLSRQIHKQATPLK